MKKYKVLMTQPTANDLKGIADYIAGELKEPAIARKLVSTIKAGVMSLEQMPTRYALVTDEKLAFRGIRKLMVDNYIIFYVISEKDATVTIIRILYGKRNWTSLL